MLKEMGHLDAESSAVQASLLGFRPWKRSEKTRIIRAVDPECLGLL